MSPTGSTQLVSSKVPVRTLSTPFDGVWPCAIPLGLLVIPAIGTRRHGVLFHGAFAALLAWSIAVQWIGTAYDSTSWDRRIVGREIQSVDDPRPRGRLWSISDNPIRYYATHRSEAVASRDAALGDLMRLPVEVRRVAP